jgi:hypothetical protein
MLKKHPDLVAECNGIFISFIELEKLSVYSKVLIDFHQWTEEKEHNKRIKLKNVLKTK